MPSLTSKPSRLIATVLVLLTVAVFSNVPHAEFVQWDDDINIYQNVHHGGLTWARIVWMFTDLHYVLYYAPLSWLTISTIYEFSGLNPFGYHLASLLLHSTNCILVYFLIRQLLARLDSRKLRMNELSVSVSAGIAALVWAIHPLRVEPVAWATGISYLVAGFFLLVSLICYLRAHPADGSRSETSRWILISVAAFLAAIISYPIVMAFPAILVLLDLFLLKRFAHLHGRWAGPEARRIWMEKIPYLLIAAAVLGFTLYRRTRATGIWAPAVTLGQFGIPERLMQACYVWAYYVWKPFVPFSLAPVSTNLFTVQLAGPQFILSVIAVIGVTLWLFARRQRFGGLLALWLCHLALLVPVLGLTEHPHYTPDRYSYFVAILASVGLAVLLVRWWEHDSTRRTSLIVSLSAAVVLSSAAFRQTLVWQNSVALFEQILSTLGDHPYRGDIELRLGTVLLRQGRLDAAEHHIRESIHISASRFQAHLYLAGLLARQRRFDEAIAEYDATFAANPRSVGALVEKASLLCRVGKTAEGIKCYYAALHLDPQRPDVLGKLAWIRATDPDPANRDGPEAIALALRACEATSYNDPQQIRALAAAYAETGQFELAIKTAERASELAKTRGDNDLLNGTLLALCRKSQPFRQASSN